MDTVGINDYELILSAILLCALFPLGETCDFDNKWEYESRACAGWDMPGASDGQTGFYISSWETKPETQVTPPPAHGTLQDTDLRPRTDDSVGTAAGKFTCFKVETHTSFSLYIH